MVHTAAAPQGGLQPLAEVEEPAGQGKARGDKTLSGCPAGAGHGKVRGTHIQKVLCYQIFKNYFVSNIQ